MRRKRLCTPHTNALQPDTLPRRAGAQWCRARPIKGPGLSRLRGVFTPPTSLAVRPYILPLYTISPLGGGWWSPAVRAFGGGSPVREVGTSSCWAPPPSRQPQCGSAAPYHGRLGATPRWGDKLRVEGHANGDGSFGYLHSPAPPSHHCDAQGAQGVKGPSPELAWPPQVGCLSDCTCTCGREPSWESRYVQRRRKRRKPPTTHEVITYYLTTTYGPLQPPSPGPKPRL